MAITIKPNKIHIIDEDDRTLIITASDSSLLFTCIDDRALIPPQYIGLLIQAIKAFHRYGSFSVGE